MYFLKSVFWTYAAFVKHASIDFKSEPYVLNQNNSGVSGMRTNRNLFNNLSNRKIRNTTIHLNLVMLDYKMCTINHIGPMYNLSMKFYELNKGRRGILD